MHTIAELPERPQTRNTGYDKLFDGQVWVLVSGEDFAVGGRKKKMENLRNAAQHRKIRISLRKLGETDIAVQAKTNGAT